jgi:hypothetical protein
MYSSYSSFVALFQWLEADVQAAVDEVRAHPASTARNTMLGMTLLQRYMVLSSALARDSCLRDNIRLQGLDACVLAAVTGLNALVFRRTASQ